MVNLSSLPEGKVIRSKAMQGPLPVPDDLVPMRDAANAIGRSLVTVATLVNNGRLRHWVDASAPARQGRRLVSLAEVVAYGKEVDERNRVRPGHKEETENVGLCRVIPRSVAAFVAGHGKR